MEKVLLEELIDRDIDWMTASGRTQRLAADELLIQQGSDIDAFYIVLQGALVATLTDDSKSILGQSFAALMEEQDQVREVIRFSVGEVLGETSFFSKMPSALTIKALEDSVVLALPYSQIESQSYQDSEFTLRFYRAIAILLLQRFERLLERFSHRRGLQIAPLHDGPLLFGELNDGDIDWMIEQGVIEQAGADQVLIQSGRSMEKLYIVLQGLLSVAVVERNRSAISDIFSRLQAGQDSEPGGREIARITQGEMIGETALLDSRLSNFTVKTIEPSVMLALPRQKLLIVLQQNPAMGTRFYRVLSILLSGRLEGLISRLGYGQRSYRIGETLTSATQYEDEIDLELIDTLNVGGARFNWMLKQLNINMKEMQ